jgi:hypothetical protein
MWAVTSSIPVVVESLVYFASAWLDHYGEFERALLPPRELSSGENRGRWLSAKHSIVVGLGLESALLFQCRGCLGKYWVATALAFSIVG